MKAIAPSATHRHTNRVVDVAFAPDGAVLACGYDAFVLWDRAACGLDNTVFVWDLPQ